GHGHHDLEGRLADLGVRVHGDAAAVVADGDAAVHVDLHLDQLAVAGEGLIDAVVDQLVDEVVQPADARVADVHARAVADVLRVLVNIDVLGIVTPVRLGDVGGDVGDGGTFFAHGVLGNRLSGAGGLGGGGPGVIAPAPRSGSAGRS